MSRQNKEARKRQVAAKFTDERKARRAEEKRRREQDEAFRAQMEAARIEREQSIASMI